MSIANFEAAQWCIFIFVAVIVGVFQWGRVVCKAGYRSRMDERLLSEEGEPLYRTIYHIDSLVFTLCLWAGLIASAIANGLVWQQGLDNRIANKSQNDNLLVAGIVLILVSYLVTAPYTLLFCGLAFPRISKKYDEKGQEVKIEAADAIDWYWARIAFWLLAFGTVCSLVTAVLFTIYQSNVGWVMFFHSFFLILVLICSGLIVFTYERYGYSVDAVDPDYSSSSSKKKNLSKK
jgi:hypothetical protein